MGRKVSLQVNSRSTNCLACADVDDMTRIREDAAELVIVFLKKSKEYECWTDGAAQTNVRNFLKELIQIPDSRQC